MAFIEPMHRNKPNITYLLTSLIGLKVEAAMAFTEIIAELVAPWGHPAFCQEHDYASQRHKLIQGVSKYMTDHQMQNPGQIQWVSWNSRITW